MAWLLVLLLVVLSLLLPLLLPPRAMVAVRLAPICIYTCATHTLVWQQPLKARAHCVDCCCSCCGDLCQKEDHCMVYNMLLIYLSLSLCVCVCVCV